MARNMKSRKIHNYPLNCADANLKGGNKRSSVEIVLSNSKRTILVGFFSSNNLFLWMKLKTLMILPKQTDNINYEMWNQEWKMVLYIYLDKFHRNLDKNECNENK